MDSRIAANRRLWNEWARINQESDFYDMAGFRAGQTSLKPIELAEVGDVAGKSLLHLQCHFGQDTLVLGAAGRQGHRHRPVARGDRAGRRRWRRSSASTRASCAPTCSIPKALGDAQFDIVFTSYGALNWLPDLGAWAQVIARHLKPGGRFHIVEFHPIISMLDEDAKEITAGYFNSGEALRFEFDRELCRRRSRADRILRVAAQPGRDRAVAARRRPHADQPARVPILRAQLLEVPGRERARPLRGEAPSRQAAAAVLDQRAEVAG